MKLHAKWELTNTSSMKLPEWRTCQHSVHRQGWLKDNISTWKDYWWQALKLYRFPSMQKDEGSIQEKGQACFSGTGLWISKDVDKVVDQEILFAWESTNRFCFVNCVLSRCLCVSVVASLFNERIFCRINIIDKYQRSLLRPLIIWIPSTWQTWLGLRAICKQLAREQKLCYKHNILSLSHWQRLPLTLWDADFHCFLIDR